ncbi:hypothetical protein [Bosea sp. FBZP-16]|uniref:hypothetical protein n=1 Tax=Bosea sp. FBZP-16 TaxID=2065382 RepID=UPI001319F90C|nr:hypothetical protein [Bosea sp. FBZP-16]
MSKFKVGDRVRTNGDFTFDPNEGVITSIEDTRHAVRVDGEGSYSWTYYERELELIANAPALTIQAGKFYKTRDGRKVGPMVRGSGGGSREYAWTAPQKVGDFVTSWTTEGLYHVGDRRPEIAACDLIAEWVDEPVASATVTFKVGDRVRCVRDYPGQFTKGKEYVVRYYDSEDSRLGVVSDDEGDENGLGASYFEPITIKVGDWVRTDNGEIGIVLHDDQTEIHPYLVGYVGATDIDEASEWCGAYELTVVPPGTAKASNDNAPILAEIDELEQRLSDLRAKLAA